ncbi:MAG: hypothetical protein LBU39_10130 [Desulfobulbaceae bacterium]|nr:hypothetical protein [Desulfobulbaceae bacterium]
MRIPYLKIAGGLLMLVSLIFIVRKILFFDLDFGRLLLWRNLTAFTSALLGAVAIVVIGAAIWRNFLSFFADMPVSFAPAFSTFARANLAKYLPGNVAHYAGRQLFGAALGVKQRHLALASLLEALCAAAAALILSALLAGGDAPTLVSRYNLNIKWSVLAAVLATGAVVVTMTIIFARKKIYDTLGRLVAMAGFYRICGVNILLTMVNLLVIGGTQTILFHALGDAVSPPPTLAIMTASVVSWFIGYIAPGAPGGIGVREAVFTLMLAPFYNEQTVLLAAVAQRLFLVFGDVLAALLACLTQRAYAAASV